MDKTLSFKKIISTLVDEIKHAKEVSGNLHNAGDIPDSGDEVEIKIRQIVEKFLPERYLVKSGHVVDSNGNVSPQLDIIIFDRQNTPKFFESLKNTVYYPIESVLAIGEIKRTLKPKHTLEFSEKIDFIKHKMNRELLKNTIYGGILKGDSSLSDMIFMRKDRKFRNSLYSFIISIDGCDVKDIETTDDGKCMPNSVHMLDSGVFFYGDINKNGCIFWVEDENPEMDLWTFIECESYISFAILLTNLIEHMNNSLVLPFSMGKYIMNEDFLIKGSQVKRWKRK